MIDETLTSQPVESTETPVVAATDAPAEAGTTVAPQEARPPHTRGRGGFGRGGRMGGGGARRRPGGREGRGEGVPTEADYEEKNLEVARVTRVTKGGKRMRFRVLSVIGNRKGRVGFGLAKGVDVAAATSKATTQARKSLITVPLMSETIPHGVEAKHGAAEILLKPAPKGAGIKAGGAVRIVLELAGVPNVVSKIMGSSNKINNVKATFSALKKLRVPEKKKSGSQISEV